jgi:hypothetical protein
MMTYAYPRRWTNGQLTEQDRADVAEGLRRGTLLRMADARADRVRPGEGGLQRAYPYRCPRCWIVSHSPADAEHRYCGACHGSEYDAHVQCELARMGAMRPLARLIYRARVIRHTWPGGGVTPWPLVLRRIWENFPP